MKLARKYGKLQSESKVEIITAQHSFHGRTLATDGDSAGKNTKKAMNHCRRAFLRRLRRFGGDGSGCFG